MGSESGVSRWNPSTPRCSFSRSHAVTSLEQGRVAGKQRTRLETGHKLHRVQGSPDNDVLLAQASARAAQAATSYKLPVFWRQAHITHSFTHRPCSSSESCPSLPPSPPIQTPQSPIQHQVWKKIRTHLCSAMMKSIKRYVRFDGVKCTC